jgi:hypothetical protein
MNKKLNTLSNIFHRYFFTNAPLDISKDGKLIVPGYVHVRTSVINKCEKLPFQFSHIGGECLIRNLKLTTLEGFPTNYNGNHFEIDYNKLTSLEWLPKFSNLKFFDISNNLLTSLEGCPDDINIECFSMYDNPIHSLEFLPKINQQLSLTYYSDLPVLRLIKLSNDCKIEMLDKKDNIMRDLLDIIDKYRGSVNKKSVLACQAELLNSKYASNASW